MNSACYVGNLPAVPRINLLHTSRCRGKIVTGCCNSNTIANRLIDLYVNYHTKPDTANNKRISIGKSVIAISRNRRVALKPMTFYTFRGSLRISTGVAHQDEKGNALHIPFSSRKRLIRLVDKLLLLLLSTGQNNSIYLIEIVVEEIAFAFAET